MSGHTVLVQAGRDVAVQGSAVVADLGLGIGAGRDLTITGVASTLETAQSSESKKSGFMSGGGLGVSIGKQSLAQASQTTQQTNQGSTVGSVGGDVTLVAGGAYRQLGSDLTAPAGDITIQAKSIDIVEAREQSAQDAQTKFKQSGLTVAITSPVLSAIQTAGSQIKAAQNTGSDRMKALAAANVALNAKQAMESVQAGQGDANGMIKGADGQLVEANAADKAGGIGISFSLGSSSNQSKQSSSADTGRGSSVTAGGNVSIKATGAGKGSDITVRGSEISAGGTTLLKADDQVNILAAQNSSTENSSQSSKSGSIGVGINLGAGGLKAGVTVSASAGKGQGAGNGTSYSNSHVSGGTVQIDSGGDTTIKGGVVKGDQVTALVGGNLSIESLQDQNQYREKSQQVGGSLTFGPSPGGSVNAGKTKINSDYLSVGEQSAIRAGDGGFDVQVQGKTGLTGAQITSTQAAVDAGKNRYEAQQGTSTTDLQNSASYSAQSASVSLGAGTQPGKGAQLSGAGIGTDQGSANSTSTAGISGIAGNTASRTGDAQTGIKPIFDKDKVRQEVNAQVAVTSEFGKQIIPVAAKTADQKAIDLRRQGNEEEAKKWDEGGIYRNGLYTALGALTGGAGGALGAAASATVIPVVGEEIAKLNLPEEVRQVATQLLGVAVGAAAGGSAGVSAGLPQTAYNYVSHSPFAQVRRSVSQENARLMNECGTRCTEQDFKRIDRQMSALEAAGNLAAISQASKLTTEQALQLGELVASLHPLYGTPIALYQAISGRGVVTQSDLSAVERFFNGVAAAVPAGAAAYKVLTSSAVQTRLTATLTASAEQALVKSGGALDRSGNSLIDMSKLSSEQKGLMGDLFGKNTVKQIVPDGQKIARVPGVGEQGLDDLYKVSRADVDYVNIEYKFVGQDNRVGSQVLKNTADGNQGSTSWIGGSGRIEDAVGEQAAPAIYKAIDAGRIESWVVTVRPDGSTAVQVLDALGKPKPIDTSKIILPSLNLSGAKP